MIVPVFVGGFLTLAVLAAIHARRQWRKAQEWAERCSTSAKDKRR